LYDRRITRWEHEHVLEAVQQRLDENPQAMRVRRLTYTLGSNPDHQLLIMVFPHVE
jgi:hypothetical protein